MVMLPKISNGFAVLFGQNMELAHFQAIVDSVKSSLIYAFKHDFAKLDHLVWLDYPLQCIIH